MRRAVGRPARDQHAEHVRAGVVHPALARLVHQRQRSQSAEPLVRRRRGRARRALAQQQLGHRPLNRIGVRRRHHDAKAHAEREQIAHGDRPLRRHRIVERGVERAQHAPPGQLGQQPIHRLVEAQHALLHEDQRRHGDDRLGHRGDADDRVARDRRAAAYRLRADRVDMGVAAPAHGGDDAGHLAALDIARHDIVHLREARRGQSRRAHGAGSKSEASNT